MIELRNFFFAVWLYLHKRIWGCICVLWLKWFYGIKREHCYLILLHSAIGCCVGYNCIIASKACQISSEPHLDAWDKHSTVNKTA